MFKLAFSLHMFEAMSRIVKEPFAPPRHVTKNRTPSFGRLQAFLAVVNGIFFRRAIAVNSRLNPSNGFYTEAKR
jgi:hypothetical protein